MHLPLLLIHYPRINPEIFDIGPLRIRWYGMAYLAGFLIGYLILLRLAHRAVLRMPDNWISDMVG